MATVLTIVDRFQAASCVACGGDAGLRAWARDVRCDACTAAAELDELVERIKSSGDARLIVEARDALDRPLEDADFRARRLRLPAACREVRDPDRDRDWERE